MLRAHKRKTRRVSGGTGRSVSPRPTLRGQAQPAPRGPSLQKSASVPTSPLDAKQASETTWTQPGSLPSAGSSAGEAEAGAGERAISGAELLSAGRGLPQGQGKGNSGAGSEASMGTLLTEWFQKLFAPNDTQSSPPQGPGNARTEVANGSSNSSSSSSSSSSSTRDHLPADGKPDGAKAAAAAGGRGPEKTSDDTTYVASNKSSVAMNDATRPSSPATAGSPRAELGSSATSAKSLTAATTAADAGTPSDVSGAQVQEPTSMKDTRDGGRASRQTVASSLTEAGAGVAPSRATGTAEAQGGDGGGSVEAGEGSRFLGLFPRSNSASGKGKPAPERDGSNAALISATAAVAPGAAASGAVAQHSIASAASGGFQPGVAPVQGHQSHVELPTHQAASDFAGPLVAGQGSASGGAHPGAMGSTSRTAATAVAGVPRPGVHDAADNGHAAGASVNASAKPTVEGGTAMQGPSDGSVGAPGAERRNGGAGGSSGSRSTSPSRAAALSVGSDDGEEENLYVAGTHQGARPSIDDFSSLRVLGKGSYGKVVLVRRKSTGVLYAMKILKKGDVVRKRQVERTKIERRVLGNVEHPFLMRLHYAFQTDNKLYLVLDYCPGGELFFHLSRYKRFPEGVVRFYAAELVLALKHLHDNNIIYRDIKPENILLDADGHIKLGDFGLAKDNVTDSTFGAQSVCGTPEYMAPEVINKAGHGTAVDWWGLGMLMYEMLTGLPPWYTKDRQKLFERLRGAPLVIPKNVSAPSASIIGGLLTRNPSKRLGTHGALQVMNHEFFRGLDWPALLAKRIPAPLNPCRNQRQGSESTHNFDPQFTRMPIDTMALGGGIVSPGPDGHFDGFTYEIPGVILEGSER